jgi:hypothetical protein
MLWITKLASCRQIIVLVSGYQACYTPCQCSSIFSDPKYLGPTRKDLKFAYLISEV